MRLALFGVASALALAAALPAWAGLTARAGVFNLTDETYAYWNDVRGLSATAVSRDAYTQPGRNLSLSLTYDF